MLSEKAAAFQVESLLGKRSSSSTDTDREIYSHRQRAKCMKTEQEVDRLEKAEHILNNNSDESVNHANKTANPVKNTGTLIMPKYSAIEPLGLPDTLLKENVSVACRQCQGCLSTNQSTRIFDRCSEEANAKKINNSLRLRDWGINQATRSECTDNGRPEDCEHIVRTRRHESNQQIPDLFSPVIFHQVMNYSTPKVTFTTEEQKSCRVISNNGISVQLLNHDLWSQFHRHQTEMIITKNGRRMFPVIKIRVFGMDPEALYLLYVDIQSQDGKRYRYAYSNSRWDVAGTGEPLGHNNVFHHPDSPSSGKQWMDTTVISFDKLKLTNNKAKDFSGHFFLHSMQKYIPRIWIQKVEPPSSGWESTDSQIPFKKEFETDHPHLMVRKELGHEFVFPETSFLTVTAYQNQKITTLKINSNPFAKGFRDNSKQKGNSERPMMTPLTSELQNDYDLHVRASSIWRNPYFLSALHTATCPSTSSARTETPLSHFDFSPTTEDIFSVLQTSRSCFRSRPPSTPCRNDVTCDQNEVSFNNIPAHIYYPQHLSWNPITRLPLRFSGLVPSQRTVSHFQIPEQILFPQRNMFAPLSLTLCSPHRVIHSTDEEESLKCNSISVPRTSDEKTSSAV